MASSNTLQMTTTQKVGVLRAFLKWEVVNSQEDRIANNRSQIRVYSYIDSQYSAQQWSDNCTSFTINFDGQPHTLGTFNSSTTTGYTYSNTTTPFGNARYTEIVSEKVEPYFDFWIGHNADGTKSVSFSHSYTCTSGGYGVGNASISGTFDLDTIPRATQPTLDIATKDLGSTFTITTTPASSSFVHKLSYTFGAAGGNIPSDGADVGGSVSWLAPTSLGSQIPAAASGTGTITCNTYASSGGTLIGTKTVGFTLTVPTAWVPVLTSTPCSFTWVNSPAQLTTYIIQNISTLTLKLAASLNSLVSSYGTSIAAYQVRFNTFNSGEITYSNAAVSNSAGLILISGNQYAYFKVKDARGNWSNEISLQVKGSSGTMIYPYAAPADTGFNVYRAATPTTCSWTMNFTASSINGANTWTYQRQRYIGGVWTSLVDASPVAISVAAANDLYHYVGATPTPEVDSYSYVEATVYQLRVVLADKFNTVYYYDTLPTSDVPLVLTAYGAGIGKIPTNGSTYDLEVGTGGILSDGVIKGTFQTASTLVVANLNASLLSGSTIAQIVASAILSAHPIGCIYQSTVATSPTTLFGGTWTPLYNAFLIGAGSTYAVNATGGAATHNHGKGTYQANVEMFTTGGALYLDYQASSTNTYNSSTRQMVNGNAVTYAPVESQTAGVAVGGTSDNASVGLPPYLAVYMWKRTA